jgi:hypothetical protein
MGFYLGWRRLQSLAPPRCGWCWLKGESGLLAIGSPQQRPQYEPTKRIIATTYSADEPERLRGAAITMQRGCGAPGLVFER